LTKSVDIIYQTRIQRERFKSVEEYEKTRGIYIINKEILDLMKPNAIIMHPLPRVDEITSEVDNDERAAYFRQAYNGLFVRMALLKVLLEEKHLMAFSLSEVESLLPEKFLESLRLSYNQNIINKVLKGIISEKKTTCRVNTLKTDISGVIKSLREYNIKFHPVPWYKNAMILDCSRREIENTSLYRDGLIYLQSLSSMIPPIVLEPRENEKIIRYCCGTWEQNKLK